MGDAHGGCPSTGRTGFRKYSQARARNVVDMLGRVALESSVSLRPMMRALERGDQVIAAIDVPADQVSASRTCKSWAWWPACRAA